MTNVVSELILRLKDDVSPGAKTISNSLQAIVNAEKKVASGSAEMNKLTEALERARKATNAMAAFKEVNQTFTSSRQVFHDATKRVKDLSAAMTAANNPTKAMAAAYRQAQREVKAAAEVFAAQTSAVKQAKSALEGFDISLNKITTAEGRLKSSIETTTQAIKRQADAEAQSERRRSALRGIASNAAMFAGPALLHVTKEAAKEGSSLQGQVVRMRAAGIKDSEIGAALMQSADLQAMFTNVKREAILEIYKEARSVLLHPEETPHMLPSLVNAKSAMDALDSSGHLSEGLVFAVKGAEILGLAQHEDRFKAYLSAFVKAQQVMGKTITPEQMFEFAKYAKASGAPLSDRFKFTTGVSLSQELGGSTTGQSIDQFVKQIVGGFQGPNHAAAKEFVRLGLARENQFLKTKTGEIKGLKPGEKLDDANLAQSDPDLYVYRRVLPAMEKAGITSLEDQISEIRRLFPAGRAADLVTKLITQRESFENHAKLYGEAQGLEATGNSQKDAAVALSSLNTAMANFAATLTSPMMEDAAAVLSKGATWIANATKSFAEFQDAHPDAAKVIGTAALGAGAIGGLRMSYGLFEGLTTGFGLKGSAAALTGAATALDAAAARLGSGAALPGMTPASPAARTVSSVLPALGIMGATATAGYWIGEWRNSLAQKHPEVLKDPTSGMLGDETALDISPWFHRESPVDIRRSGPIGSEDRAYSPKAGGTDTGAQTAQNIAAGLEQNKGIIEQAAAGIMAAIQAAFAGGVTVPVKMQPSGITSMQGIHSDVGVGDPGARGYGD